MTYENMHVPISVSIGDTLEREPTHICDLDAKELIRKFMEELKRRGRNIRALVHGKRRSSTYTQEAQCTDGNGAIRCRCLVFNCGRYDLNLIKEHFAELLADTTNRVKVAKKSEHYDVYEDRPFPLLGHH